MGADLWVLSPGMLLRGSDATINQNRQGEQAESDEEEVAGERMGGGESKCSATQRSDLPCSTCLYECVCAKEAEM